MADRYYFRLSVTKNGDSALDVGLAVENDPRKAQLTLNRILKEYIFPQKEKSAAIPENPTVKTDEPLAERPDKPARPVPAEGKQDCLLLHCSACGDTFGTYLRSLKTSYSCKCGHQIQLDVPFARYSFTCPGCGEFRWGQTNSEDPEIECSCKCGTKTSLRWAKKEKKYLRREENKP